MAALAERSSRQLCCPLPAAALPAEHRHLDRHAAQGHFQVAIPRVAAHLRRAVEMNATAMRPWRHAAAASRRSTTASQGWQVAPPQASSRRPRHPRPLATRCAQPRMPASERRLHLSQWAPQQEACRRLPRGTLSHPADASRSVIARQQRLRPMPMLGSQTTCAGCLRIQTTSGGHCGIPSPPTALRGAPQQGHPPLGRSPSTRSCSTRHQRAMPADSQCKRQVQQPGAR